MNPVHRWFCVCIHVMRYRKELCALVVETVVCTLRFQQQETTLTRTDTGTPYYIKSAYKIVENVILMMCNLLCCRWDRHAHAESERVTLFCFYSSMFSIISSYFNINTFLYVQAFGKSSVENKLLFQFSINVCAVLCLSHSLTCHMRAVNAVIYNKLHTDIAIII